MTAPFQLDTSGAVAAHMWRPLTGRKQYVRWCDLSPFCQGYTAAILEAANAPFHKLARATLARIIADCEGVLTKFKPERPDAELGGCFWVGRNKGTHRPGEFERAGFPPLTVTLGDDGLIYLREAGQ